jgi:hypothetical protein
MRRTFVLLLLSLAIPSFASAAGWKKAYFGATKPGTWARYVDHSSDPANADMTVTQTRLGDDEGRLRIELKMDSNGKYPLVLNRYTMKSGFNVERDLIDFGPAIVAGAGGDDHTQNVLDDATVKILAENMPAYGPSAVFKGSELIDGKKADRYSYTITRPGNSTETGDLWLSDAVPFGMVRNTFTITETAKTTTFERKLIASGTAKEREAQGSTVLVNQQTTIMFPSGSRSAELSIRSVVLDNPGGPTVYGMLVLVRDAKTGLFWWDMSTDRWLPNLAYARRSADQLSLFSNGTQLVAFTLGGDELWARSSVLRAASLDAGEKRIQHDVRAQLRCPPLSDDCAWIPPYTEFALQELFGRGFILAPSDTSAAPAGHIRISRIAWERHSWVVDVQNFEKSMRWLQISSALKLVRSGGPGREWWRE